MPNLGDKLKSVSQAILKAVPSKQESQKGSQNTAAPSDSPVSDKGMPVSPEPVETLKKTDFSASNPDLIELPDLSEIDLSDPNALELLLDDGEDDDQEGDEREQRRLVAEKTLLSVEITRQKGVEIVGDQICVPGRIPLMPVTLLEILFVVIGFSAGLIHFSVMSPNYLLSLFVISFILLAQIAIYHSAYRSLRIGMTVIQTIGTLIIMTFVGWAYYDLIAYPVKPNSHHLLLGLAFVSFEAVPLLMLLHLIVLGRGHRWIEIKRKPAKTPANTPTKVMKTAANTPTKQMKSPENTPENQKKTPPKQRPVYKSDVK